MKHRLPLLTNSAMRTMRRCAREYYHAFVLGYRPTGEDAEALRFGSLIHHGLELFYKGEDLEVILEAVTALAIDAFEAARARVMLRGYDALYSRTDVDVLGVEEEFRAPLINPETGAASRTFQLAGKLDLRIRGGFMEHKTASGDLGPGSTYWKKLTLDSQVSTYYAGCASMGHEVEECVYDVLKKPAQRPYKATPVEDRKYTKKDGKLYANQRESDETPEEYELRIAEDMTADPLKYFQRGTVVRLESEIQEAQADAWHQARAIREAETRNVWPRNVDSCERFHRMCAYWPVCSGEASIDDPSLYERVDNLHPELTPDVEAAE